MKKKILIGAIIGATALAGFGLAACEPATPEKPHTHSPVHHAEEPAKCNKEGVGEYWSCSGCDSLFSDADCANVIAAPATIPTTDHSMTDWGHNDTEHWTLCEYCGEEEGDREAHDKYLIIGANPTKSTYYEGETFDPAGMTVLLTCDCGVEDDVTAQAQVQNADTPLALGTTSLTVAYDGYETIVSITVNEYRMVDIEVALKPGVAYYNNGKAVPQASDFEVTAIYNTDARETLSADKYTVTTSNGFTANGGTITVKVSNTIYKEITYELVEVEMSDITIKVNPTNTVFRTDEAVSLNGLVITVAYNDGSTKDITSGWTCDADGKTYDTEGNVDAVISYTENGVTKTVNLTVTISNDDGDVVSVKFADDAEYVAYAGVEFAAPELALYAVYESGRALPLEASEYTLTPPTGTARLGSVYALTATLNADNTKSVTLPVRVVAKVEGENYTKLVGGSKKTEAEYIQGENETLTKGENVTFVGDFAKAAIAGTGAYAEWRVTSSSACDAEITFSAGNSNLRREAIAENDEDHRYKFTMEALRVNAIADLYINGVKVNIPDSVVLGGCGASYGKTTTGTAGYAPVYGVYNEFTINGISLGNGINIIKLAFKDSTTGEKNVWGESPSTMNIDWLELSTNGNANPVQATVESLAFYEQSASYGDSLQSPIVIATMSDGSHAYLDPSLYDLTITGDTSNDWFTFGDYSMTATLKSDNTKTVTVQFNIEEYAECVVKTAEVKIIGERVYYIFGFTNVGYTVADYEFFDGSTIYTIDQTKTETTYNSLKLYIDVTDLSARTINPHLRIDGKNYVNGANSNGDIRGSSLSYTNGQSVTLNGKKYTISTNWSMPSLVIAAV